MVYDITDPEKTEFVNYINSRDFSTDIGGDDSPEGIHFISSSDSITGKAQLIVAYEVSGTVGVYDLTLQKNDSEIIEGLPDSTIEELDNNQKQAVDTGDSSNFSVMGIFLTGTIIIMIILDRKELTGNRD